MVELDLVRAEIAVLRLFLGEMRQPSHFRGRVGLPPLWNETTTGPLILRSPKVEIGRYLGAAGFLLDEDSALRPPFDECQFAHEILPKFILRMLEEGPVWPTSSLAGLTLNTATALLPDQVAVADQIVETLKEQSGKQLRECRDQASRLLTKLDQYPELQGESKHLRSTLVKLSDGHSFPLNLFAEAGLMDALASIKKKEPPPAYNLEALAGVYRELAPALQGLATRMDGSTNALLANGICRLARYGGPEVVPILSQLGLVFSRHIPMEGALSVKGYSAVLDGLVEIGTEEAALALVHLSERAQTPTMRTAAGKRLNSVAHQRGITQDALFDAAVPTFDLNLEGFRDFALDGGRIRLSPNSKGEVDVWFIASEGPITAQLDGPFQHAGVPANRKKHPAYKEAIAVQKALQKELTKQRRRIENWLLIRRMFNFQELQERVLLHPLLAAMAKVLIWNIDRVPGLLVEDRFCDANGNPISVRDEAECTLWHPLDSGVGAIEIWRDVLFSREITQPIKQAFREVYLLTDAERTTGTYSNRFAAHVLRQGQFAALAKEREWSFQPALYGNVVPLAKKPIPGTDLVAEFSFDGIYEWTEGLILEFVTTDALRFTRHKQPVPLEDIPRDVFSEVCRDCDLFVSVSAAGNDPTWVDQNIRQEQWRQNIETTVFGELAPSAESRKAVLSRLLPRMKIGSKSRLEGRWLIVQGEWKSYKIHLGSGNILMSPNDQYLCIVPKTSAEPNLYLPFEGDRMLGIILSKAEMLARESEITDPTILSQLGR